MKARTRQRNNPLTERFPIGHWEKPKYIPIFILRYRALFHARQAAMRGDEDVMKMWLSIAGKYRKVSKRLESTVTKHLTQKVEVAAAYEQLVLL